jgi:hypothetical protein
MPIHNIDREVKELLMQQESVLLIAKQAKGVPGGSLSTPQFHLYRQYACHIQEPQTVWVTGKHCGR